MVVLIRVRSLCWTVGVSFVFVWFSCVVCTVVSFLFIFCCFMVHRTFSEAYNIYRIIQWWLYSWLMLHGSWLKAHGPCLKAHGHHERWSTNHSPQPINWLIINWLIHNDARWYHKASRVQVLTFESIVKRFRHNVLRRPNHAPKSQGASEQKHSDRQVLWNSDWTICQKYGNQLCYVLMFLVFEMFFSDFHGA